MAPSRTKRTLDDAFDAIQQRSTRSQARNSGKTRSGKARRTTNRGNARRCAAQMQDPPPNSASSASDDDMYEVESILKEQGGQFFVKWAGYDSDDNTWEPECNLKPQLVKQFRQRSVTAQQQLNQVAQVGTSCSDGEEHLIAQDMASMETSPTSASDSGIIGAHVVLLPSEEEWMTASDYRCVGSAYLTGVISREYVEKGKKRPSRTTPLYELRWTTTQFQMPRYVHGIPHSKVLEGNTRFNRLSGNELRDETWDVLCRPYHEEVANGNLWDEFEEVSDDLARYDCCETIPEDVGEVERVSAMEFEPRATMTAPDDLFRHEGGGTSPHVKPEFEAIFKHSASSSFLAYLPLAFWKKVVDNTNAYAADQKRPQVTLDEMMKFLGVLFYMALVDKGEYTNYWGEQVEDSIFDSESVRLDPIMTLARFKFNRKNLSFRHAVSSEALSRDPAARIRPLMNMLKLRAPKFVVLGRNVAVDGSSIACRSRFARHLIVFNATKPTGKYHFKIYMCCCSESWLMANFRLHCASEISERLEGVISDADARALALATEVAAEVRKCVAEVMRPIHHSGRIVNTDNYYTSCQLLEMLRVSGLYGRGTIRENSKHYPRCVMISKKDNLLRGAMKQAVSKRNNIVAASWVDGSVVNIVSNADSSTSTTVYRQVNQAKRPFTAPMCVIEYNSAMQGVDRIDQLRARFSVADGHSFRKWHKKLALAFIDLARCNAYITRKMAGGCTSRRDPHREFMVELIGQLISGAWRNTLLDSGLMYATPTEADLAILRTPSSGTRRTIGRLTASNPTPPCYPLRSQVQFPDSRAKRGCVICRFEGRYPTEMTDWCTKHLVSLCTQTHQAQPTKAYICQDDWTCWKKFHEHYLSIGLCNQSGRIRRSSSLYKRSKESVQEPITSSLAPSECSTVYT